MLVISDEINKTEDMTLNSRLLNNVILLTSSIQLNRVVNRNVLWWMSVNHRENKHFELV